MTADPWPPPGETVNVRARGCFGRAEVIRHRRDGFVVVRFVGSGVERKVSAPSCRPTEPTPRSPGSLIRPPSYDAPETTAVPKDPPIRDEDYLRWVRVRPCACCGHHPPSEASHHVEPGKGRMGAKTDDTRTLPLCRRCHGHYHQHGALIAKSPEESRAWVEWQLVRHREAYAARHERRSA